MEKANMLKKQKKTENYNILNIQYFHDSKKPHSCGYCKENDEKKSTNYSSGFSTDSITPHMYEKMMFAGWRRCGKYIYKPDLEKTCCKLYTLRLETDKFKINKNQKRVMKNFRKYLIGEKELKTIVDVNDEMKNADLSVDIYSDDILKILVNFIRNILFSTLMINLENSIDLEKIKSEIKIHHNPQKNNKFGDYSTNLNLLIFHQIKNCSSFKQKFETNTNFYLECSKLFKQFVSENDKVFFDKYDINISEKTGHLNFIVKSNREEFIEYITKFQEKKKLSLNKPKKANPIQVEDPYKLEYFDEIVNVPVMSKSQLKHHYTLELEKNSHFTNEKFEVYKKYQRIIHKDEEKKITPDRYKDSWGSTNLKFPEKHKVTNKSKLHPENFGTYDLIHRIDGKIVAVGILDILPNAISSVYLYYDPDLSFLNLGIFTAVREIEYIQFLKSTFDENIKYYAMGFFSYTCQKLKYKGEYFSTELLCPVNYNFVELSKIVHLIKDNKYVRLTDENDTKNLEFNITKTELETIKNELVLYYQEKEFKLMFFVNNYISEKFRKDLIKNVELLIHLIGKNNIKEFKLVI